MDLYPQDLNQRCHVPNTRLSMRKMREIYRLHFEAGLSQRAIARALLVSTTTVGDYLNRFESARLRWPLDPDVSEVDLEQLLFPGRECAAVAARPVPDWTQVQKELIQHKKLTLQLLWTEYHERHGARAYSRSRFFELYRIWRNQIDVTMRQEHTAGETLFVDYAGLKMTIINAATGQCRQVPIFVAAHGASNYTYSEATESEQLRDWIDSHVRAFEFFGGTPRILVPDNLKTGVTSPCYFEPDLNQTYHEMATHYGVAVVPARVCHPQDKSVVEKAVQQVEREVLAPLRSRQFFSVSELNQAMSVLLKKHNERPFQKLAGSRLSYFEELDQPALGALPATRYEYADWKSQKLPRDYHVEFDSHYYSAPYRLKSKKMEIRATTRVVEIFHRSRRVASHVRSHVKGAKTTLPEHMPDNHRAWAERSPEGYIERAVAVGPSVGELLQRILGESLHPQLAFRSCEGILRLAREYGSDRTETASRRALLLAAHSYKHIRATLENSLENEPVVENDSSGDTLPSIHVNLRGSGYYQ